jgi:uncharacterized OB-fold protein
MSVTFEPADLLAHTELFRSGEPGDPSAILASRCTGCARTAFPRTRRCAACGAGTESVELASGVLDIRTAVTSAPPGALVQAPYEVGVARFPGHGICVIGLLDGPVDVGDPVRVVIVQSHPEGRIFGFRAAGSSIENEE